MYLHLFLLTITADMCVIRHGESTANVNPNDYDLKGDPKVPLTDEGRKMAEDAAKEVAKALGLPNPKKKLVLWVSPFTRTRETAREILKELKDHVVDVKEEQLLKERDFGLIVGDGFAKMKTATIDPKYENDFYLKNAYDFQNTQRFKQPFYLKAPFGESQFDVLARSKSVLNQIHAYDPENKYHHIVVTHGVTARTLIMAKYHFNQEWYAATTNPCNAAAWHLGDKNVDIIYAGKQRKNGVVEECDIEMFRTKLQDANRAQTASFGRTYEDIWTKPVDVGTPNPPTSSASVFAALTSVLLTLFNL